MPQSFTFFYAPLSHIPSPPLPWASGVIFPHTNVLCASPGLAAAPGFPLFTTSASSTGSPRSGLLAPGQRLACEWWKQLAGEAGHCDKRKRRGREQKEKVREVKEKEKIGTIQANSLQTVTISSRAVYFTGNLTITKPSGSSAGAFFPPFGVSLLRGKQLDGEERKKELGNKRNACMVVTNVVSDNLTERKTNNSYHNWGMVFITLEAPMIH